MGHSAQATSPETTSLCNVLTLFVPFHLSHTSAAATCEETWFAHRTAATTRAGGDQVAAETTAGNVSNASSASLAYNNCITWISVAYDTCVAARTGGG